MPLIEIKSLSKHFGSVRAIDEISFDVDEGEVFGFLGPNGAGKTTTIRCMMDFIRPTSGEIFLMNKNAQRDGVALKWDIGYLSGSVKLYDNWTGQEHINFARALARKPDIATELIERTGFDPRVKAKQLSSGNKQKLGLILAFMFEPRLLILDEPTNALDPILQNTVYDLIREQTSKGATVFMSSHNLTEVERVCSRVGVIRQGKIVALESVEGLRQKQMYNIKASFQGVFDKADFFGVGEVTIVDQTDDTLLMKAKSEIGPVLRVLSGMRLKNLEIKRASLEDIFLEYYQ